MTPLLINAASVAGRTSDDKLRHDYLLKLFGTLLPVELPPFQQVAKLAKRDAWRTCIAEELLLRHACGLAVPEDWYAALKDDSPFANEVCLHEVWGRPSACALFPLGAKSGGSPGVGHVWVSEDLAHRATLDGGSLIPGKYGVCIVATHEKWSGKSWQLAGQLALQAVQADKVEWRRQLATQWLITGQLSGEQVAEVELGNKLDLRVGRRTWMIPRDNVKHVTPEQQRSLRIRSAHTVSTAWSGINGQGTKSGVAGEWPQEIDELHMLVGSNIKAQVASALLSGAVKKIVLWCSESQEHSIEPAEQIEDVLNALKVKGCPFPHAELCELPSADIAKAENKLRTYFEAMQGGGRIVFNVTSGNRLMSYAVQTVALLYPDIELIYREIGCKTDHEFVRLSYAEFPPFSGTVMGAGEAVPTSINWDFLYDGARYADADDFLNKLFMTRACYAVCKPAH